METQAKYYTASELSEMGKEALPTIYQTSAHLIYSSPATLAYNSPGAEGFGVKRAGLAIPESVMLIVSPGCCGRNTSTLSSLPGYKHRFFYLTMDETDLITGRHLKKIPKAVKEVVDSLEKKPSVVMICITCVDALLGTDMERVSRKAEEYAGVKVRPCYMYALTREGRLPPMSHVRQSLYSILQPRKKKNTTVNFLGYFAPLLDDTEIYRYLKKAGVKTINEISRCETFDKFMTMAEANFNLVLNAEARAAVPDFDERLHIPSIELTRFYDPVTNHRQYMALANAIGIQIDDREDYAQADEALRKLHERFGDLTFAIGECVNANPFELAYTLLKYGFKVSEIYATLDESHYVYVDRIAKMSPDTKVYSNNEPTMLYYAIGDTKTDITIGKDAKYYNPNNLHLDWNEDIQPYGYSGLIHLTEAITKVLEGEE